MALIKDISVITRQRCAIEFCVKLEKTGQETLQMLQKAYGSSALSRAAVFKWWRHFKRGKTKVLDETPRRRLGALKGVTAKGSNVRPNEQILIALNELSANLNVSLERAYHIIKVGLKMNRVCARFISF